jgi:NADPH:quinone reductase-like Zn-dependent oxidoreductase
MSTICLSNLPKPVTQAIKAIQDLDSSEFVSSFTPGAVLIDEAKQYITSQSIKAWFEKGMVSHKATIRILEAGSSDNNTWMYMMVDGNYEEEYSITKPFPLYMYFLLSTSKNLIQRLRVNQIGPNEPTMRGAWAASGNMEDPLSDLRNDVWRIPQVPEGWIRVKVVAASLNYHDIFTLRGIGMFPLTFPLILGNEAAGTLDDGTEVVVYPVMGNPDFDGEITHDPDRHVLGEKTQGSLAEFVIVPEGNVIKKPKNVSFETASVLGIVWLTAYRMLFVRSGLKKGQKMLVQGSTGGVATALIQLGRAAGMTVWCTGRTEEKRRIAMQLGAHRTFATGEQLPEQVAAVFDMSGEQTFKHSMESVGTGGTIVSCGMHSGAFAQVDLMKLFTQEINIHGTYAGNREDFEALIKFVSENEIKPLVQDVLPLERAGEGLKMILEGTAKGKVIIRM